MASASTLYFAYGSNMWARHLRNPQRCPSARFANVGFVSGHRLTFDKKSTDGSGKCDAEETSNAEDVVHGVVFEVEPADWERLKCVEKGYRVEPVVVHGVFGEVDAVTLCATSKEAALRPFWWYKQLVLRGALEHKLPAHYLALIEKTLSAEDPNPERAEKMRAILDGE